MCGLILVVVVYVSAIPLVKVEIPIANISPSGLRVTPEPTFTSLREVSDPAVKLVTIPVVALKVAAVVIPAISTPVGDSVTVPTPDRLLILSTLISDAHLGSLSPFSFSYLWCC